jgi:hypothetical protein
MKKEREVLYGTAATAAAECCIVYTNALRSAAVNREEQQQQLYSRGKSPLLKTANLHQMLSDSCTAQAI